MRSNIWGGIPFVLTSLIYGWIMGNIIKNGFEGTAIALLFPSFSFWLLLCGAALLLLRIAMGIVDLKSLHLSPANKGALFMGHSLLFILNLYVLSIILNFFLTGSAVFQPEPDIDPSPPIWSSMQSLPSGEPAPSIVPDESFILKPSPEIRNEDRLTVLLIGVDNISSRDCCGLTDTLLLVSVNPEDSRISMISFPRDIAQFPLYTGGTYTGKINSLMHFAQSNPSVFNGASPQQVLRNQIGFLAGIGVNYYAMIDINGFLSLIDAVGGVTVNNSSLINDPTYSMGQQRGFYLEPGKHHLDSEQALAYIRSRKGAGDNDFTRASRQQEVVLALYSKLASLTSLGNLNEILQVTKDNVSSNYPADRYDQLINLWQDVQLSQTNQVVLGPPYSYHPPEIETGGSWILRLIMDEVEKLSLDLFGSESFYSH